MRPLIVIVIALSCCQLQAMEKRLRQGPDELFGRVTLLSQHVDEGLARTGDAATHLQFGGRFYNIGGHLDAFMSMDNDRSRDLNGGDFVEFRARLDYLYENPGYLQVLPFYETATYPEAPDGYEEPQWLGVDVWYLLPVEGVEFGGSVSVDAGDEHGYRASLGFRQFYQQAPLDLSAWQLLHFGDEDYHAFLGADPETDGPTTVEVGAEALVPLPWIGSWMTAGIEAHWWALSDDRDARDNDTLETMFSIGIEWRM